MSERLEAKSTLRFYMRSGNMIIATHVVAWDAKYRGETITSLTMTQTGEGRFVHVGSVALEQIEAIVETKHGDADGDGA